MKLNKLICAAAAVTIFFSLSANNVCAAKDKINVVVIDGGVDFTHRELKPLGKANKAELKGKTNIDDDKNGYVDDVYGWNFVDNNAILVDLNETPPEYDKILKVKEFVGRFQAEGSSDFTKEEWDWMVSNSEDPKLKPWISFCGNWAHGTHCAGIIGMDNPNVKIKAIRHIDCGDSPQMVKNTFNRINLNRSVNAENSDNEIQMIHRNLNAMYRQEFIQSGKEEASRIKKEGQYIASLNPRLINCSFNSDNESLFYDFKNEMTEKGYVNPSDEEIQYIVNMFVKEACFRRDKALYGKCKNSLIFVAAGNEHADLDKFLCSPTHMPFSNKIVIAATDRDLKLAEFSNYGKKSVDVAVPGVNIYSTYPNQKMGHMSGTSMACPNALKMASSVLAVNNDLTPIQLKQILMKTVDKKTWLKDKVKSGGVINERRAIAAAQLVKEGKSISEACKAALKLIPDKITRLRPSKIDLSDPKVKSLYFNNVH